MRRIEHDRAAGRGQDRERAHVGDQAVVPEREAPFRHQQILVARRARLLHHPLHLAGREELPLLQVHRFARAGDRHDEVGLPAEEGRGLQHVDDGRDLGDLLLLVHVGQHGEPGLASHLGEDGEALLHADAAEAVERGAVRLVEGGLVHDRQPRAGRDLAHALGVAEGRVARLDDARPGDQRERRAAADGDRPDTDPARH